MQFKIVEIRYFVIWFMHNFIVLLLDCAIKTSHKKKKFWLIFSIFDFNKCFYIVCISI